ncbi:ATP-binding protein [Desulfonatronovibrio hydrogenovorans]|uniref:ATP-binding protein n=1 Tax=Desulfonatronovibrio hydrogenovorans TaxID=53245 RepID=UPI00048AEFA2|nr:ATP-binding protein [Desulfonatronovibrio hydrogenovorans]
MREVVIISGKGGTGKTSLTGAFAHVSENKIICDLDVDAPDLHILLDPINGQTHDFYSGHLAVIDNSRCRDCGICLDMCRYKAILYQEDRYVVDGLRCEGCKVCVSFCPDQAIDFPARHCGHWFVSSTRFGTMVHAQLTPGAENSGRLVSLLRQKAREKAELERSKLILCDGAPGIGCPVISSLSGTDLAVIVAEPTLSGVHDLKRVASLCTHFKIKTAVLVNKFDLNLEQFQNIREYCLKNSYVFLGGLVHDPAVTRSMVERKVITECNESPMAGAVRQVWKRIEDLLQESR